MIDISNSMAQEIIDVTDALRRMAFTMDDTRSRNIKRRARLITNYLDKKKNGKRNNS